jgi:hypothetical protein
MEQSNTNVEVALFAAELERRGVAAIM